MKLAVFADIHGSLPALEAALAETEREGVDGYIVAGDMLAGPNPAEVMDRLLTLKCWMIRGNQEDYILRYYNGSAPAYWYHSKQWAWMHWNYQRLNHETLAFISTLPDQRSLHFPGTGPIKVVHGSPRNISELVFPDRDSSLLDIALSQVSEPVLILGHTHLQWALNRHGKLALNPGGLSGIFSGKPCGGYAILNWEADQWQVELRELHYDIELIRRSFAETGVLKDVGAIARCWLHDVETGINTLPRFVHFAFEMAENAGYKGTEYVPDHIWDQAAVQFGLGQ